VLRRCDRVGASATGGTDVAIELVLYQGIKPKRTNDPPFALMTDPSTVDISRAPTRLRARIVRCSVIALLGAGNLPVLFAQSGGPAVAHTDRLNLGFEAVSAANPGAPAGWYVGGQGYQVVLDTAAPFAGARSLRIRPRDVPEGRAFGVATSSVSARPAAGKTVRLRGYIRTEGIAQGYAGLWLRTDAADGRRLALENMGTRGVTGTTPWVAYEITVPVDTAAVTIVFGVLHPGDGTAWFDSLAIDVDGRPLGDDASPAWAPTAAQQTWVRRNAIPLAGVDAAVPMADLQPLHAILGDARVVALGEGTHGTSEFFRMKHRLTEFLAGEGFTVFAIEANMPEARRLNDYVLTGRGDPAALLAGMYFWTWNTREVFALIEWMRVYNASGSGRMEFWGFDLQTPDVAMDSVRTFVVRTDPGFAAALDTAYGAVRRAAAEVRAGRFSATAPALWRDGAARVLSHLEAQQRVYAAALGDTTQVAWAVQYARIVLQGAGAAARGMPGAAPRDSSMAANVRWMLAHQPAGTKAVLWAHNGHVQRAEGSMGGYLDAAYGPAMRVVGFALGEGDYTGVGGRGLTSYPAEAPPPGSVESVLRAAGMPRLALDLRAAARSPDGGWLAEPHDFRSIGAGALDRAFFPTPVAKRFDVLVYVDRTTPTRLMPTAGGRRQ
jgi:erythromycin esterase